MVNGIAITAIVSFIALGIAMLYPDKAKEFVTTATRISAAFYSLLVLLFAIVLVTSGYQTFVIFGALIFGVLVLRLTVYSREQGMFQ